MNKTVSVIAIILAILLVMLFTKDLIVKSAVEGGVKAVTGLNMAIKSFKIGILKTLVDIQDLKVYNPAGYEDKVMLDMPEIYVDYDLPAIIGGKLHLPEVRLNMKEFVVVKNADGELNLNALKVVKEAEEKPAEPAEKKEGKAPEFQIDVLELKVGKVYYKDYSKGGEPSVKEFDINLNERYENISDPETLARLIIVRAIAKTSIAQLTNFDLKSLQGTISGTLATAQQLTSTVAAQAGTAAAKAGETAAKAAETVEKAAEGIGGSLLSPFGAKKEE